MQSNFQILQSQALMVFICMHWTVFNTTFNEEKCFHLSVLIYSNIYWGLLKSFSHRVFYLDFMYVYIVSHAHNSYCVVLYCDMIFYYIIGFYCKVLCTKERL